MRGLIFDLKRFAVHDGPGIRSTLFVKGCPLHCPWCQNPEGMKREIALWRVQSDCIACESCAMICPKNAIELKSLRIDRTKCTLCGKCIEACPAAALSMDGREVDVEEAADMLLRDVPFYENGGVTISGGEVFSQWQFCLGVLDICHKRGVDTAIESCMYTKAGILLRFLPVVDHFIMDIKYLDDRQHLETLGVHNDLIQHNFELLVSNNADVLVRTPLIPGYTANEDNIRSIARYLVRIKPDVRYELLNYNPLCKSKYCALGRSYPVQGGALTSGELAYYENILRNEGIKNIVRE